MKKTEIAVDNPWPCCGIGAESNHKQITTKQETEKKNVTNWKEQKRKKWKHEREWKMKMVESERCTPTSSHQVQQTVEHSTTETNYKLQ